MLAVLCIKLQRVFIALEVGLWFVRWRSATLHLALAPRRRECHTCWMHKMTTTFLLAVSALVAALGVQAQSTPGDMSRYESIHEAPKTLRGQPVTQALPKAISSSKNVETIGPSVSNRPSRLGGLGMSETAQPIVRPGISMKAGGAVAPPRAPAPVAAASPDAQASEPPADDGKGGVINGVMRTR